MTVSNSVLRIAVKTDESARVRERSRDRSDRFPHDQLLRSFGFVIHARPKVGESYWTRGGKVYSFTGAVEIALRERDAVLNPPF